jgi:hypothetical protein
MEITKLNEHSTALLGLASKLLIDMKENGKFDEFPEESDITLELFSFDTIDKILQLLSDKNTRKLFLSGINNFYTKIHGIDIEDIKDSDVAMILYVNSTEKNSHLDSLKDENKIQNVSKLITVPLGDTGEQTTLDHDKEIVLLFIKLFLSNSIFFMFSIAVALEEGDPEETHQMIDDLLNSYRNQTKALIGSLRRKN